MPIISGNDIHVYSIAKHMRPGALFILPRCMQCRRGLAMRKLSVCPYVRLSMRQSVKRVDCDKTEERSVQIFIPYERSFILVFWEEEWLVGATPSTWNFGSTGTRWSEIADFQPIFARSVSAVTSSEKVSINTNRKSITRLAISLRWSYVAPKPHPLKKGSKTQNGRFQSKIALRLKKVCYKISLCENCQRQSCEAYCPNYPCNTAVTLREKSSINTNRKSTARFPMSPRWTLYVVPKRPNGTQTRNVSKIWTISCDNSETVRDRMSVIINQ